MRQLKASEFKAKCLAVIGEVSSSGTTVTILKRGKPVARLSPATLATERYPQDSLHGSVEILDDVVGPALPPEAWEAERRTG